MNKILRQLRLVTTIASVSCSHAFGQDKIPLLESQISGPDRSYFSEAKTLYCDALLSSELSTVHRSTTNAIATPTAVLNGSKTNYGSSDPSLPLRIRIAPDGFWVAFGLKSEDGKAFDYQHEDKYFVLKATEVSVLALLAPNGVMPWAQTLALNRSSGTLVTTQTDPNRSGLGYPMVFTAFFKCAITPFVPRTQP